MDAPGEMFLPSAQDNLHFGRCGSLGIFAKLLQTWWPGTELNRLRQPLQYYQLIPIIFQQLNFAERPQFCAHSVTSADVRLSVGPNLIRAACQRPVDLASPRRGLSGRSQRNSRLLPVCPSVILGHWRHVHARAGEALEVVFAHRLHLGWCGPDAGNFEPMRKQVEGWQKKEVTDVTVKVVIYQPFVEGKLEAPKHLARNVQ
jgi:hypothetical protein